MPEIKHDVFPYLREYNDGTVERLAGTEIVPAGLDPETGVVSEDIIIVPDSGVSARVYHPKRLDNYKNKLPLMIYFRGGAFCISSTADPKYHRVLNLLVAEANIIAISINYRNAPEHPLPTAYEDSWDALKWVASNMTNKDRSSLWDNIEFGKVFLGGDSAGANISHHLAIRAKESNLLGQLKFRGILMIHPYFWGKEPIGCEGTDTLRKAMVDKWWLYVCPSEEGTDDPLINPFADGSPSLTKLACERILVCVAEKDILRDRGVSYYESLEKSGWQGSAEILMTEGEDHVFHIFDPNTEKARNFIRCLAAFIMEEKAPVA
ncbi:Alpha/beta hydrolase fold-3 [Dillenia turbinata]|uniref:Alpha/beta hydrolase fold-3 n=1 Tax=Dillenia turbinata TaxID=194707 RepID=A0AAN8VSW4_9MAGN